jgi:hypothetical protein
MSVSFFHSFVSSSLRSQQLHYAELLKISVVLIGDFNTIRENEAGPSGRAVKGVGLRPLAY